MATDIASQPAYCLLGVDPVVATIIVDRLGSARVTFDSHLGELQFSSNLLHDVPWDVYDLLVNAAAHGRFRHTYDNGTLEMMSPLLNHESTHRFIARLLEAWCNAVEIPIIAAGSTTQRSKIVLKGVEPDSSFYVQHEPVVRKSLESGGKVPPPDLAVEVDTTSSSLPRLPIYARMKVPEVWRYDGKQLAFLRLSRGGRYQPIKSSSVFSLLEPEDVLQFLVQRGAKNDTSLVNAFVRQRKRKEDGGSRSACQESEEV